MKKIDKYLTSLPSLDGKKVIITGANSGLGFCIAEHCLRKNAKLVFACRNREKANAARDNLLAKYPGNDISILIYDQSSIKSCKQLAKEIIEKHEDFYALVLNAGVLRANKNTRTQDGFLPTTGINALGTLAIIEEMQSFLNESYLERRIVIQGSLTSRMETYKNYENYMHNPKISYFKQYANSKNALLAVYLYYGRNNLNEHVKYLYSEPGISSSNIIQNFPNGFRQICAFFYKLLFQSSAMGALPAVDLICNDVYNEGYSVPKHLFKTRGLPKRIEAKRKHIHLDVVPLMLNDIRD